MIELKFIQRFPQEIMATDEVGRGPLCGPVVIGAVRLLVQDQRALQSVLRRLGALGVADSKKLTPLARNSLLNDLGIGRLAFRRKYHLAFKTALLSFVVWDIDEKAIDQENILAASLRGMREAALFLSEAKNHPTTLFIDGNSKLRWGSVASTWTEVPIVKGDCKSRLIGLASILAKVTRDAYMKEMHVLYPQYGFHLHSGYPTALHRRALQEFGPSPIHRKSFKGVREFVGPSSGNPLLS